MKILLYDGTLNGYLTCVFERYYDHKDADGILPSNVSKFNFLDEYITITSDKAKSTKVRDAIIKKASHKHFCNVKDAMRSENPNKEKIIFSYISLLLKHGNSASEFYGDKRVTDFNDLLRKVYAEFHRLIAFVRFMEMKNNVYYAYYSSDNDIIDMLGREFVSRLNTQQFVLHDYKRKKMLCYDGKSTLITAAPDLIQIVLSEREKAFTHLWQQYHKNVTIKERKNLRLQRNFLPKKYRHFMSEFQNC